MIEIALPSWLTLNEIRFLLGGLVGSMAHFVVKRAKGEIAGSLYRYMVVDYPGRSFSALVGLVAATAAAEAVGGLSGMTVPGVVAAGFTAGYATDSAFNKGSLK
jgi:hypothetical protein